MKKYLKYLIPLFSIFIFSNVYALADVNFVTPNKPTALQNCLNSGVCTENQFWEQMLTYDNVIEEDTTHNYYTIYYQFSNNTLYYIRSENPLIIQFAYNYGNSRLDLRFVNDNIAWRTINYTYNSNGIITEEYHYDYTYSGTDRLTITGSSLLTDVLILATNQENYNYGRYVDNNYTFSIDNGPTYSYQDNIPIDFLNGTEFNWTPYDIFSGPTEPTYTYTETILESGNVRLDFTFTNYSEGSNYAFEIENSVSNEEYGITNPFSNIFPNIIPYGNSYSIELSYDSLLYVTLSQYTQVEQTTLYYREEIYTQIIDINNVVFENTQDPYFVILSQSKHNILGGFANTTSSMTCWYRYSTSQTEDFVPCDEQLGLNFYDNGYAEVIIKKGNSTIYTRKINYLGSNQQDPYIVYTINKQDFYSVINWYIENEYSNITYRYSTNNGTSYSSWSNYNSNDNNYINVFENSTIIIDIANSNQDTIYDSKAIVVINDITNIKNINNSSSNFVDKFKSLFNVNSNILSIVNTYYSTMKSSKLYLLIFVPFLTTIICAIIYLIRRK